MRVLPLFTQGFFQRGPCHARFLVCVKNVSKMDTSKFMFQDVLIGKIIGSEPGFSGYQILRQTQCGGLRQDSVTSGAWVVASMGFEGTQGWYLTLAVNVI